MATFQKHNKRNLFSVVAIVALLAVYVAVLVGGVDAKYVTQSGDENVLAAREFYFSSNILSEEGSAYTVNAGTNSTSFTLTNSADKLRHTEYDIRYEVTCNDEEVTITNGSGTLNGNAVSSATVIVSGLKGGNTYTVTAVGTGGDSGKDGYKKTLTATFTVMDDGKIYKHLDTTNPAYVVLTLWTEDLNGNVTVSYDGENLIPDHTDNVLKSIYNYNSEKYGGFSFTDTFEKPYSSRTYRFFIAEPGTFSADQFTVTLGEKIAAPGTP